MITSSILPRMSSHTEAPTDNASRTSSKAAGSSTSNLSVAIIGGGIVSVVLAHGLLQRGIRVTIYERGPNFQETGAGMAFTGVSRESTKILSPLVISAMNRVGMPTRRPYDNYWDGYHNKNIFDKSGSKIDNNQARDFSGEESIGDPDGTSCDLLFSRSNHQLAFWGCLRKHFLDDLASSLPANIARFNKELKHYTDPSPSPGPITLSFADGSTAVADVLIGCDDIWVDAILYFKYSQF
jgi:salicylate hydroxylase